jgi:hypothetical protein
MVNNIRVDISGKSEANERLLHVDVYQLFEKGMGLLYKTDETDTMNGIPLKIGYTNRSGIQFYTGLAEKGVFKGHIINTPDETKPYADNVHFTEMLSNGNNRHPVFAFAIDDGPGMVMDTGVWEQFGGQRSQRTFRLSTRIDHNVTLDALLNETPEDMLEWLRTEDSDRLSEIIGRQPSAKGVLFNEFEYSIDVNYRGYWNQLKNLGKAFLRRIPVVNKLGFLEVHSPDSALQYGAEIESVVLSELGEKKGWRKKRQKIEKAMMVVEDHPDMTTYTFYKVNSVEKQLGGEIKRNQEKMVSFDREYENRSTTGFKPTFSLNPIMLVGGNMMNLLFSRRKKDYTNRFYVDLDQDIEYGQKFLLLVGGQQFPLHISFDDTSVAFFFDQAIMAKDYLQTLQSRIRPQTTSNVALAVNASLCQVADAAKIIFGLDMPTQYQQVYDMQMQVYNNVIPYLQKNDSLLLNSYNIPIISIPAIQQN